MAETHREPSNRFTSRRWSSAKKELIDPELESRMDVAQRVVGLVRSMRAKTNLKTRQPLSRIAVPASAETRRLIEQMNDVILEEINVKAIEFIDESSPIVRKTATPNFKVIGPKFGKHVNAVAKRIKEMSSAEVIELDQTGTFSTEVNGAPVNDQPGRCHDLRSEHRRLAGGIRRRPDRRARHDADARTRSTKASPASSSIAFRTCARMPAFPSPIASASTSKPPTGCADAVSRMSDYVKSETLATQVTAGRDSAEHWEKWEIDGESCEIGISKAG